MEQQIWFITGISSGLGQALAHTVMERGDYVIGTFRKASQVADFNQLQLGRGEALVVDITKAADITAAYTYVQEKHGRVDVLVNNAGFGFAGAVEEASDTEVRTVMEANFFGTLAVTRQFLPLLRAQKSGRILQISSHAGIKAFPGFGIYNAAKFALEGFSEALAAEVAPLGIKLMIVQPGPFRTGFAGSALYEADQHIADYESTAGIFRAKLRSVHGQQEGDPVKAAAAIYDITRIPNPPLRLPLGKIPLKTIQMKLDSVQQDLNNWREVAEGVTF